MIQTSTRTWYEIWRVGGYGAKLCGEWDTKEDAEKEIEETIEHQKSLGYKPESWRVMICNFIATYDDGGTIWQTTTYARA